MRIKPAAAEPRRRAARLAAGAGPWRGDYREPFGFLFCSRGLSGCFGCLSALLGFPLAVPFRLSLRKALL